MSAKHRTPAEQLKRLLKILYWVVFAISLVVVVGFIIFRVTVKPPEVESEVTIPPQTEQSQPPEGTLPPGRQEDETVLTRREGVYTCLLMGSDDGNNLADTIMIGVFDTGSKTASLISVPRDTLVAVGGGRKINSVYAMGGAQRMREVLEAVLAIPIDFYVEVELEAFSAIVNEVGGVWFDVPMDMDYEDPYQDLFIHVKQGYQLLDGEQALGVMRFRSGYASQDLGRTQTQRAFLAAMVEQAITLSNATKVGALIRILNTHVSSDMPLEDMVYFATQAVGMDLSVSLRSAVLPNRWVAPYVELDDEKVLELLNSLGIYEQDIPAEALKIAHK